MNQDHHASSHAVASWGSFSAFGGAEESSWRLACWRRIELYFCCWLVSGDRRWTLNVAHMAAWLPNWFWILLLSTTCANQVFTGLLQHLQIYWPNFAHVLGIGVMRPLLRLQKKIFAPSWTPARRLVLHLDWRLGSWFQLLATLSWGRTAAGALAACRVWHKSHNFYLLLGWNFKAILVQWGCFPCLLPK